mmetsp:Transcript_7592/g.21351  ORF Transcript_7592/g.21351 Transcript_7592/m.21351 type:complete len:209 (+) Transcript_7592:451-1077(+)
MHRNPACAWVFSKPVPQSISERAMRPQAPQTPCTAKASTGSSTLAVLSSAENMGYRMPATTPIPTAEPVSTEAQPAEIAAMPAKTPKQRPSMSFFLFRRNWMRKAVRPENAAASVVFMATCAASMPFSIDVISMTNPQFSPYQPHHAVRAPKTTKGWLCGVKCSGISRTRSFADWPAKRPGRWPATTAPASAQKPPVMCTTPLPAKSW